MNYTKHSNESQHAYAKSEDKELITSSFQLEDLKKAIFQTNLSNESKLDQLKKSLSLGQYSIQSQSLASKLLEHVQTSEDCEFA